MRITGDADRVLTMTRFESAEALGVRTNLGQGPRDDGLDEVAARAAAGRVRVPIARTFPLEDYREVLALSASNRAGGKLLLIP